MVTIEMKNSIYTFQRQVGNYFNLFVSTGGLYSFLYVNFNVIVTYLLAYRQYESYIASKLFQAVDEN